MCLPFDELYQRVCAKKEARILMLGLESSGKTTILYQMKLGEMITTIPTIGYNLETVKFKNVRFRLRDVGGQKKMLPLWSHYFGNTQGLIFVVDSNNRDNVNNAQQELSKLLYEEELKDAVVLVFANKQDRPKAMDPTELAGKLNMERTCRQHHWYIQGACAITGEGLYEGLDWLCGTIAKKA